MRKPTGLHADLQARYTAASKRALPGRRYAYPASDWADYYARREPLIEEAMGGICWNYPDREIVAATMRLLTSLAGPDFFDPVGQRRALAKGFRTIADMIEENTK